MRDKKGPALSRITDTRLCRMRSMLQVLSPGFRVEVWADTHRPTHSLLDVQLGTGPSMGLGPDYCQQLEDEW